MTRFGLRLVGLVLLLYPRSLLHWFVVVILNECIPYATECLAKALIAEVSRLLLPGNLLHLLHLNGLLCLGRAKNHAACFLWLWLESKELGRHDGLDSRTAKRLLLLGSLFDRFPGVEVLRHVDHIGPV